MRSGWRSRESTRRCSCSGATSSGFWRGWWRREGDRPCASTWTSSAASLRTRAGCASSRDGWRALSPRIATSSSWPSRRGSLPSTASSPQTPAPLSGGVKLIRRAQTHCVEILPALAYPEVVAAYPELLERPILAGGLLKSQEDVSSIVAAGAAGISTSHQGLWRPVGKPPDADLDKSFRTAQTDRL